MKCEICSDQEAVVHFKHVDGGEVRELNICEGCAAKHGLSIQPPDLLTDFLMGKIEKPALAKATVTAERQCMVCGMKDSDFNKISRFGCGECYVAFEKDVEDVAAAVQKTNRHIGKFPQKFDSRDDIAHLKGLLDDAVAVQNFEEAARLRDIIEKSSGSGHNGSRAVIKKKKSRD